MNRKGLADDLLSTSCETQVSVGISIQAGIGLQAGLDANPVEVECYHYVLE